MKVSASPQCVVRLTNTGPERAGGNRFKLEAFMVRPGDLEVYEGMQKFDGSERAHIHQHVGVRAAWRGPEATRRRRALAA